MLHRAEKETAESGQFLGLSETVYIKQLNLIDWPIHHPKIVKPENPTKKKSQLEPDHFTVN